MQVALNEECANIGSEGFLDFDEVLKRYDNLSDADEGDDHDEYPDD